MSIRGIPIYDHFNHSLQHLHLRTVPSELMFYVFKWNYSENYSIAYPLSRQAYFDITFFVKADFTHNVNTFKIPMKNNSLHIITPGQAEHFNSVTSARQQGYAIYFKPDFLFETMIRHKLLADLPFLNFKNSNVYKFTKEQSNQIQKMFEGMIVEQNKGIKGIEMVRHHLVIFLYSLKYMMKENPEVEKSGFKNKNSLTAKLEDLLKTYNPNKTSIVEYANLLKVTPRFFTDSVKNETGKTPKQIIKESILLEAKLLLQNAKLTSSEIAFQLHFHYMSHFTKFFLSNTGLTPRQYRKNS